MPLDRLDVVYVFCFWRYALEQPHQDATIIWGTSADAIIKRVS